MQLNGTVHCRFTAVFRSFHQKLVVFHTYVELSTFPALPGVSPLVIWSWLQQSLTGFR